MSDSDPNVENPPDGGEEALKTWREDIIKTREHAAEKDSTPPDWGLLNPKSMPSSTALSGTNGGESVIIHGDRWYMVEGKHTETVKGDFTTHILGKENRDVMQDLDNFVGGITKDTRTETVNQYFLSESTFHYILEHTDAHFETEHLINPTHTFQVLNVDCEAKTIEASAAISKFEGLGTEVKVVGGKAEAWGAGAEAFVAQVGVGAYENKPVAVCVQEDEMHMDICALWSKIIALEDQAGASRVIIMPVRVGICIAVHIDSPFA